MEITEMLALKIGDKIETPLGYGKVFEIRSDLSWIVVLHGSEEHQFEAGECLPYE